MFSRKLISWLLRPSHFPASESPESSSRCHASRATVFCERLARSGASILSDSRGIGRTDLGFFFADDSYRQLVSLSQSFLQRLMLDAKHT